MSKSINIKNISRLKKTLTGRFKKQKVMGAKPVVHEAKGHAIKDLIFIMSEVATYLKTGDSMNLGKLFIEGLILTNV